MRKSGLVTVTTEEIQNKISSLPPEGQARIKEANDALQEMCDDVFDFDSEDRIRKAGWTPQQAEDIAFLSKKHGVGIMFPYKTKILVLTPFKTVVDSQVYLDAVQNRLLEVTTVPVEIEVANLKSTIQAFTSLSFFGLIKLAFKRLLNRG